MGVGEKYTVINAVDKDFPRKLTGKLVGVSRDQAALELLTHADVIYESREIIQAHITAMDPTAEVIFIGFPEVGVRDVLSNDLHQVVLFRNSEVRNGAFFVSVLLTCLFCV